MRRFVYIVLLLACLWAAPQALAAESYDNCTGFIESLPATITSQGTWCLRKDLSTGMSSGDAITIATNNVTIDCNDFKIGGLAAGDSSLAYGIYATGRQNITVRHCNIRGFYIGIFLSTGAGYLVEDNRFNSNLYVGINISGENNLIRRNLIFDTGGNPNLPAWGIYSSGSDILDNIIAGVSPGSSNGSAYGIQAYGTGISIRDNQVRGLAASGTGEPRGILAYATGGRVSGNHVNVYPNAPGVGITGSSAVTTYCDNNTVGGFATAAIQNCNTAGGHNVP